MDNNAKEEDDVSNDQEGKKALDISLASDDEDDDAAAAAKAEDEEEEAYAAPMHLHALRTPAKLRGAPRSRSSSRSRPGSRRNSSSPPRNLSGTALSELVVVGGGVGGVAGLNNISPSISVGSSLDGIANNEHHHYHSHSDNSILIDRDILLDKLGFRDLDPDITHGEIQDMLRKHNSLPTLNERMSEETMDDVHAFQNLTFCKRPSTGSSTGSIALEESFSEMTMMGSAGGEDNPSSLERAATREGFTTKMAGSLPLSSPVALQLNTLDEEEEEGVDDDDCVIIEEGAVEEEDDEEEKDILDIPDSVIHLRDKSILNGKLTSSIVTLGMLSSTACGGDGGDEDEDDDDDAEVEVPTSIIEELDINDGKRKLLHRDTSLMVVGGSDMDFLEEDEQDGLEADLANVGEES